MRIFTKSPTVVTTLEPHAFGTFMEMLPDLVGCMREWIIRLSDSALPRAAFGGGDTGLVVTAAPGPGGPGLRVYASQRASRDASDDATLVYEPGTGRLEAIFLGPTLGRMRTGLLGGVAAGLLAPHSSGRAAIVGCGGQALAQALVLAATRPQWQFGVYGRSAQSRHTFIETLRSLSGIRAQNCHSAQEAVADASVVVVATSSDRPVVEADWVDAAATILHIGPKCMERCDLPVALYQSARTVVTDAPAQLRANWPDSILRRTRISPEDVVSVADLIRSKVELEGPAIFHSLGLAGTEVLLARELVARTATHGIFP